MIGSGEKFRRLRKCCSGVRSYKATNVINTKLYSTKRIKILFTIVYAFYYFLSRHNNTWKNDERDKVCTKTFCLGLLGDDVTLGHANGDILDIDFQNIFAGNRGKCLSFDKCMKPGCSTGHIPSGLTLMTSSNEIFPMLVTFVRGIHWSPVTSPHKVLPHRPVTRSFEVFFNLCLNKWLSET